MSNVKFEKKMISKMEAFKERLTPKHLEIVEERYLLINKVSKIYKTSVDTVTFYKNPYLFTLSNECNKDVRAKVEGNMCLLTVPNKETDSENKCLINFTTKRYLPL